VRITVKEGCLIVEDMPTYEERYYSAEEMIAISKSNEERFLWDCRHGNIDLEQPIVDLRQPFKLASNPYRRYTQLAWVNTKAENYGIEVDESFSSLLEKDRTAYAKVWDECWKRHVKTQTAKAEEDWSKLDKSPRTACNNCFFCRGVIDGDLYCAKYKKDLDVTVEEEYDGLSGKHMMFASHGIPLAECQADELKELEKEKAVFIDKYVNGYGFWSVEDEVEKIMNEGERTYV
jgi:hypothetical protein